MKAFYERLKDLSHNYLRGGIRPHHDIEVRQRIIVANTLGGVGMVLVLAMALSALAKGNMVLFLADSLVFLLLVGDLLYLRLSGNYRVTMALAVGLMFVFFSYLFMTGGMDNTGFLWLYSFPVFACFVLGSRSGVSVTGLFLLVILTFLSLNLKSPVLATYTESFKIRFIVSFILVTILAFIYERLRESIQAELKATNLELLETVGNLTEVRNQLQEIRGELEERVARRTAELSEMNQKLLEETKERRRQEESLRESEGKLNAMLAAIDDRADMIDREFTILWCNEAMLRHYGSDIIGQKCYRAFYRRESPCESCPAERTFHEGIPYTREVEQTDQEGRTSYLHLKYNVALRDEGGAPQTVLVIARDITEAKRAQEKSKELEEKLKRAEKMEAVGALAGGVAHDLNNILSGIVGYPQLLLMQLPEDSPLRSHLLTIQSTGEKAAAIVQDMLTLTRRGVATFTVLDLNSLVGEYLKSPEHGKMMSYHPSIVVKTRLDKDLLRVLGSKVHILKSLMNLVNNAAEAMPQGGTILITTENRYLDKTLSGYETIESGEYVTLTVSDRGIGIPKEDIDKIFEPFYTKKKLGRSGTGLGMTVVWGTIKDHHGYIDIKSVEKEGTEITLYFPATRQEATVETALSAREQYLGKGESVLVVDDMPIQREIASGMLSALGYKVQTAASGEEALEFLQTNRVDLVILDMIMEPGIDGLETYRRMIKLRPGQKALIASGFSATDRVREAQRLGAGAYLKKPYTFEQFGLAVRAELEGRPPF